jgi:hypothetical protein
MNKLIISVSIVALIAWIFYIDSIRTNIYLSKKEILPATRDMVFQTRPEGRNVILGDLLRNSYTHKTSCVVADKVWKKHKIIPIFLGLFSYPIKIRYGEYDPFLKKEEFDFLAAKAKVVRKMDIDNRIYFLIDSIDAELGVFCYEINIIVAPLSLVQSLGG